MLIDRRTDSTITVCLGSSHPQHKNSTIGADASGEFQQAAYIQFVRALTTHSDSSAKLKYKLQQ